jgi:clan AA aspartic protease (TIGR02281 family)
MDRCPKCRALTAEEDHYCRRCGARLDQTPRRQGLVWFWLALAGAAMAVALVYWAAPEAPVATPPPVLESGVADLDPTTAESAAAPSLPQPPAGNAGLSFPSVWVRISDASGREIAALPAPLVGDGWVALPRQEVLGGAQWEAELPDGQRVAISAGVQADGDTIGLWQLETTAGLTPPPLAAWESEKPVVWRPLASDDLFPVTLDTACNEQFFFEHCLGTTAADTVGVLLQDGKVVGWTFDRHPGGRFFWAGATGDNLQPSLRVSDFYRLSFAEGREEHLLLAMENQDLTTVQRLAALAAAFAREPRLSTAERRELFDEAPARERLHQLVDVLLANEQAAAVADNFDGRLLAQLADPDLSGKAATAAFAAYGGEFAMALMDEVLDWSPEGAARETQTALYHKLALQTLKALADTGAVEEMQLRLTQLAERFPDSAAIYLYQVEAALLAGDTTLARELLAAVSYPEVLQDRALALGARIDEAAALAQGILIPFTPGGGAIVTEARLNGLLSQRFLVDTGATLTTIPTATADRLGLSSGSARHRRVKTAGGEVIAWETRVESIVLADTAVTDLTVLVLDIPDNPNLGLLGMNFIRNFEVDLDNAKGQLMLRPR